MKKILTTLTLLLTLCSYAIGQDYDYYFDKPITGNINNMHITAIIYIDGVEQTDQNIELAAFYNDVVRGRDYHYEHIDDPDYGNYYARMIAILGNDEDYGATMYLKAYNHDTKEELTSNYTFTYSHFKEIGSFVTPEKIYFESSSIAQIGDTKYESLVAAVKAANNNETITLLKNAEGEGVVINKSITIDFNEKTYTFTTPAVGSTGTTTNGFQILNGNTVTLQNGTLNVAEANKGEYAILIQNYANLTLSNMEVDATNVDYTLQEGYTGSWAGYSYALSINSGNVNIINSTIKANDEGDFAFAFDVCKYANYAAPVVNLDATSTISSKVEFTGGQLYNVNENLQVVAKKEFTPQSSWETISAPIVGGATIPTTAEGTYHDLYRYNEAEHEWEFYGETEGAASPFSTLELGRGYLYAAGDKNITVELNGTLNVNDVVFPLSYTEGNELAGFNMVGNPFAHNINEDNFSASTLSEGYYVISENGEWLASYESEKAIAPMQSVLVKTSVAGNLTITKAATNNSRSTSEGSLKIDVVGNNCQDVAYVSFNEGIGLDKISHNNSTSAMLYITSEGKDYAVATMSKEVTEIPVSFKAMTMGEYTISAQAQNCDLEALYLIDKLTGEKVNLNIESYSFMATSNDNPDRFVLKTTETLGIENNNAEAFVYINNNEIIINNIQGHAKVNIIDMMGRQVASHDVFESAVISTSSLERGVYVIQMTDTNGIRTQKVLVD